MKSLKKFNIIGIFLLLVACSSNEPTGKTKAEVLFKDAEKLISKKRYIAATERLNLLRSQHPYSFYATPAELLQADILFLQQNYIEAAGAYLMFRDLHPKHEKIVYVIYRIGESYYKQLPSTHDRDLTSAYESLKYFQEVVEKYPQSNFKEQAEKSILNINEMLEKKEKYIADYYFKTKNFEAARFRYLEMINQNISNQNYLNHSKMRVIESSLGMDKFQECLEYTKQYASSFKAEELNKLEKIAIQCGDKLKKQVLESKISNTQENN